MGNCCVVGPCNPHLASIQGREIDLTKIEGSWYVIGVLPTPFEKGAHNAVETYTWDAAKKRFDVDFTFNKGALDGPVKAVPQKLYVPEYPTTSSGRWKVSPFGPLRLDYIVMDLAEDYSWIVIGHPGRKYFWIMSKSSTLDSETYEKALQLGRDNGFPVDDIVVVPHNPET